MLYSSVIEVRWLSSFPFVAKDDPPVDLEFFPFGLSDFIPLEILPKIG